MTRLLTTGFGSGAATPATDDPLFAFNGGSATVTNVASPRNARGRALQIAAVAGSAASWNRPFTATLANPYYGRWGVSFSGLPAAGDVAQFGGLFDLSGNRGVILVLNPNGQIAVWTQLANTFECSSATIVAPGALYVVELEYIPTSGLIQMRINGTNDGAATSAEIPVNTNFNYWSGLGFALATSSLTMTMFDLALNDTTGSSQNGWCGLGTVNYSLAAADSQVTGFTEGAGGTGSLFDTQNNVPPIGVALGSATNASQIKDATSNTTDNYQPLMQTYLQAGVPPGAVTVLTQGIARQGNSSVTSRNAGVQVLSNPVIAETVAGSGTTAAATEPTGWSTILTAVSYAPVALGTPPVMEFRKATASTDSAMADWMAILIEWTPAPHWVTPELPQGNDLPLAGVLSFVRLANQARWRGGAATTPGPVAVTGSAAFTFAGSGVVVPPPGPTVHPSGRGQVALRTQFPLRLLLGQEDVTFLLDNGFTFSSVDPGGFEMASLIIPKDMPNTLRGMPIRLDTGLRVAWEGRVSEVQRSLGNQTTITGEGYGAVLKDGETAQIFVDRDLTYWTGPSVQRQINLVAAGYSPASPQVAADASTGNPSLALAATGPWAASASGGQVEVEALYDAQGVPIASIYCSYVFGPNGGVAFNGDILLSVDDLLSAIDQSGGFFGNGAQTIAATLGNRVFAALQFTGPSTAGGVDNTAYAIYYQDIAVYGNHGLPQQGGLPGGFFPSQIATWAMQQAVGLQPGVIPVTDATGYIVPHSVYLTAVGLDQIVDDMATAAGWHWGVWESLSPLTGSAVPRLDFRPRPVQGAYTASCLRGDTETCDIREALSGMYNTAIISYTSVDGLSRSVTVTADNPVLDTAGINRTVELNGGTMTESTANVFGAMALDLLYQQARVSGSVEISGPINSLAGPMPAWLLKPGIDRLKINDLPSVDAFGIYNDIPITRMECSGSTDGLKTSLEVGQGGNLVETLQSRLASAATLAAQGGS